MLFKALIRKFLHAPPFLVFLRSIGQITKLRYIRVQRVKLLQEFKQTCTRNHSLISTKIYPSQLPALLINKTPKSTLI
jgi:hypothetical protein